MDMSNSTSSSENNLTENEMVFRNLNEGAHKSLEQLKRMAKEDGQEYLVHDTDTPMHYYCECADENCHKRLVIKPSEYTRIHSNRKHFIVSKEHDIPSIEKIVGKKAGYYIVEKYKLPRNTPTSLNETDVDNR